MHNRIFREVKFLFEKLVFLQDESTKLEIKKIEKSFVINS